MPSGPTTRGLFFVSDYLIPGTDIDIQTLPRFHCTTTWMVGFAHRPSWNLAEKDGLELPTDPTPGNLLIALRA
jgi:hypothetical protein